jgi:hypothetical protein
MRQCITLLITLMLLGLATFSLQAQVCGDYDDDGVLEITDITSYVRFFMTPDGIGPISPSDFDFYERLTMRDLVYLRAFIESGGWPFTCLAYLPPYIPPVSDEFKLYYNGVFPAGYDSLELALYVDCPDEFVAFEFPLDIRVMGIVPDIGDVSFDPEMDMESCSSGGFGESGEKALLGVNGVLPAGLTRIGSVALHTESVDSDRPITVEWTVMNRITDPGPDSSVVPGAYTSHEDGAVGTSPVLEPFVCGDINGSGGRPDISDLTYLVEYLFLLGDPPVSMAGANVSGQGEVDISDLTTLVNYLFVTFGPRPSC